MILYVDTFKTLAAYLTTILFRLRLAPIPVDDEGALVIIYNYDVFLSGNYSNKQRLSEIRY